jgi:hypothetical protein
MQCARSLREGTKIAPLASQEERRLPAISSIAAPLIVHSTVSPLFSIVNWKAIRSASYPKIMPRISGIEKLSVTTF